MTIREMQKHRNSLHTLILLIAMFSLMLLLGESLIGTTATLITIALSALVLTLLPRASGWLTLRLYHAEPVACHQAPQLHAMVDDLSRRAGLAHRPALYLVPSNALNAFALEEKGRALIALTSGLLRGLERRELAAVIAHEIAHIRNGDLHVMMLADFFNRITAALSHTGLLLALILLPLWLLSDLALPWLTLLLLLTAPMISTLLQLALSRTREFDADVDAAGLTSDPLALASALSKIEQVNRPWWQNILFSGLRQASPSLLRTHPVTTERVRRLRRMAREFRQPPMHKFRQPVPMPGFHITVAPSRWHPFGIWY